MNGFENNPGSCEMVSKGVIISDNRTASDNTRSNKRPLPMPSTLSKKRRLAEPKPTLSQLIDVISVLNENGKHRMPLHLLKPHQNPLFSDICKKLILPKTRKVMDRTKNLWNQYLKIALGNVEKPGNNEKTLNTVTMDFENDSKTHTSRQESEVARITDKSITQEDKENIESVLSREKGDDNKDLHKEDTPGKETDIESNNCEIHQKTRIGNDAADGAKSAIEVDISTGRKSVSINSLVPVAVAPEVSDDDNDERQETIGVYEDYNQTFDINHMESRGQHEEQMYWEYWITTEDWNKVKEKDGEYSWFMVRELIKLVAAPVFKKCLINFTTHRKNRFNIGEPVIVYYGKCKQDGCRQFRFDLTPNEDGVKLTISANGELRHNDKLSSRLSGLERSIAKQELLTKRALAFRSEKILKAEAKTVLSGNLLEIRSLDVFRQARAEAAKMMDKHNDDGIDLMLRFREDRDQNEQERKIFDTEGMKNEIGQIIQKIGEPLHVYLYSKFQLETLLSCLGRNCKKCVLHIDSTGSVVRPLKGDRKTVYYYSGCVNVSGKLLPILDLVSCQHDVASIASFFLAFVHFQKKNFGNKCIITHIVIDFSTALLSSVILAWNRMTVLSYLIKVYKFCTKASYRIKGMVTIHLCCSHFMHMASGDLAGIDMPKDVKKFYLCCIASLINCSTFEEFKFKVQALVIVTKSENHSVEVDKAKTLLEGDVSMSDSFEELEGKANDSSPERNEKNPIYKASPFYKVGKEMDENFNNNCGTEKFVGNITETHHVEKNVLRSNKFWDLFLIKYMPYAPLWSGFLIRHSSKEQCHETRFSNASVEGWFKLVKESVLDGITNQKVGRFVEKLSDRIMSICKEIYLEIPIAACNKKKTSKKTPKVISTSTENDGRLSVLSGNDEHVEETWMKKPDKKITYFETKFPEFETKPNSAVKVTRDLGACTEKKIEEQLEPVSNLTFPIPLLNQEIEDLIENHDIVRDNKNDDFKTTRKRLADVKDDEIEYECRKQKVKKVKKYGPLELELSSEDYQSLEGSNWVTGAAIDAVAENLLRTRANFSYCYVSVDIGTMVMKGERIHDTCFINMEELLTSQYLLLPYSVAVIDSHWCLVVVDMKNKVVFHFDSLAMQLSKVDVLMNILRFFDSLNSLNEANVKIDLLNWCDKSRTIQYQKQNDDYNCGVFVLYYMVKTVEIGLKSEDVIENIDIQEFRNVCLSILEDSEQQFCFTAMENGLVELPRYYVPDTEKMTDSDTAALRKLTVGYKKNKNMGKFLEKIIQADFMSLTDSNWLTSIIVDYCNATFVRDGQFCFAIGEATFALKEGRPKYTPVFKPVTAEFQKLSLIFVPYNISNHFCLYVIDLKNKCLTHLDPMNDDCFMNEKTCEKIKEFLRVRNRLSKKETINVDELKYINITYPLQNDSHSCGVYVIYYLSALSNKNNIEDIDLDFNSREFRAYLQLRCLRESLPLTNHCLLCGNGSDQRRQQWCQCNQCGRWIHYLCMKTRQSYESLRRKSTTYTCLLCTANNISGEIQSTKNNV